jgi:hypothetical protein
MYVQQGPLFSSTDPSLQTTTPSTPLTTTPAPQTPTLSTPTLGPTPQLGQQLLLPSSHPVTTNPSSQHGLLGMQIAEKSSHKASHKSSSRGRSKSRWDVQERDRSLSPDKRERLSSPKRKRDVSPQEKHRKLSLDLTPSTPAPSSAKLPFWSSGPKDPFGSLSLGSGSSLFQPSVDPMTYFSSGPSISSNSNGSLGIDRAHGKARKLLRGEEHVGSATLDKYSHLIGSNPANLQCVPASLAAAKFASSGKAYSLDQLKAVKSFKTADHDDDDIESLMAQNGFGKCTLSTALDRLSEGEPVVVRQGTGSGYHAFALLEAIGGDQAIAFDPDHKVRRPQGGHHRQGLRSELRVRPPVASSSRLRRSAGSGGRR